MNARMQAWNAPHRQDLLAQVLRSEDWSQHDSQDGRFEATQARLRVVRQYPEAGSLLLRAFQNSSTCFIKCYTRRFVFMGGLPHQLESGFRAMAEDRLPICEYNEDEHATLRCELLAKQGGLDDVFVAAFRSCLTTRPTAFQDPQHLAQAIRECRTHTLRLDALRQHPQEPGSNTKLFAQCMHFLPARHSESTASLLAYRIAEAFLPPELIELIKDQLWPTYMHSLQPSSIVLWDREPHGGNRVPTLHAWVYGARMAEAELFADAFPDD